MQLQVRSIHGTFLYISVRKFMRGSHIFTEQGLTGFKFGADTTLKGTRLLRALNDDHARRSLHGWGDTQWPINPPPTTVFLSFTFISPERCKVSQQVWNRVMN